ncbi:IS3 family transposase [Legionella adelaidensis]|uniref:IS3 family transposase n=1 Tax=Legionella adelaidensis TaxID=45056 RepID=UPI0039E692C4
MVRQLRKYSKEFKEESAKLAISYGNINKAADELGIPRPTLHEWVNKVKATGGYENDSGLFQPVNVAKVLEENKELKKRLARLEQEKLILKKAATLLRKGTRVKYGFIKEFSNYFSVTIMCALLNVSRSGYYSFINRPISKRQLANNHLDINQHKKRYGVPRITRVLQDQNEPCSHTRVARRMQAMGLTALAKKKFKVTTDSEHSLPIYKNHLGRDFSATAINQKWACDITYIRTLEGWLYLAVVIDLYSRAVIGWSMNKRMKKNLVCDALSMALFRRKFPIGVIVHSDRGSQYCSLQYQQMLKQYQLIGSMSRRANCWDNAIAESFFHTLKVELIHNYSYQTREQAKLSVFQYIEGYFNQQRIHSALDYKAPFEFECAG